MYVCTQCIIIVHDVLLVCSSSVISIYSNDTDVIHSKCYKNVTLSTAVSSVITIYGLPVVWECFCAFSFEGVVCVVVIGLVPLFPVTWNCKWQNDVPIIGAKL